MIIFEYLFTIFLGTFCILGVFYLLYKAVEYDYWNFATKSELEIKKELDKIKDTIKHEL